MVKNKFGIEPLSSDNLPKRKRTPGPMGVAVRETASNLAESTEAKVEQRKQNAADAKSFRAARDQGLVLSTLPLAQIETGALPRDRLDLEAIAQSDEMAELKTSIAARGQREPVEVFVDDEGRYQLKKGWRRYTALSQLHAETGDPRFAVIIARVAGSEDRIARYLDMVEENIIREDLTFAEMAALVLTACADPDIEGSEPDAMVGKLYGSLHKMKRSYIRSFVFLLQELGSSLKWPKSVSRNLGVDVARALKAGQGDAAALRADLDGSHTPDAQNAALAAFLSAPVTPRESTSKKAPRQKFEFHVGATKVTARKGECRLVSDIDFSAVPRERLVAAVSAFRDALKGE